MKALVTGGGGFLGGAIVRQLRARGDEVRSFSRGDYPELRALGIEVTRGDLADPDAVASAVEGCDIVFHVAAKAGVWGPYEEYYRANVLGTQNVIAACRRHSIGQLVYTDDHLATVALRPHLIFGPDDHHLVPRLVARGKAGTLRQIGRKPLFVDCTYIDNAAHAHLLAADRLHPGSEIAGKVYFISQGDPRPLWDLINMILKAAGVPPVTRHISPVIAYAAGWLYETVFGLLRKRAEPPMTRFLARELSTAHWFNISAARRDLGYEPLITTDEGIALLAKWLQEQRAIAWDSKL